MEARKNEENDDTNLLKDEEVFKEIIKLLDEKILNGRKKLQSEPKPIASTRYTFYRHLVMVNRWTILMILAFSIYSSFSFFFELPGELATSIFTGIGGLILEILVLLEVFKGAGIGVETEYSQGDNMFAFRTFNFIPSINSLAKLLLFIGCSFVFIIIGFSGIYLELCGRGLNNFTGILNGISAVYFSLVTFATVGYGEIYPSTILAQTLVSIEIFISLFSIAVVLATTISWVTTNERQRHEKFVETHENKVKEREEFLRHAGLGTSEDLGNVINEAKRRVAQKKKVS